MGYLRYLTLCCSAFFCFSTMSVQADETRDAIFGEADSVLAAARQKKAFVLVPESFGKGYRLYQQADASYKKGKNLLSIQRDLDKAIAYLEKSLDGIKLAEITFNKTLKAREDAQKADAKTYSSKLWTEAEKLFVNAALSLERGNRKSAERSSKKAVDVYRTAELEAIKGNYLNETKSILASADKLKVKKYAPKTLTKAQRLLLEAERALTENRYDIDEPRDLARQAKYEAKHAIYLAKKVYSVKDKKLSVEDLILEQERAMLSVAGAADIVAELDKGFDGPASEVVAYINGLQEKTNQQATDIEDLESQLGALSTEQAGLKKREEFRKKAEKIERMFTRDEATVLRRGNDMILRMIGLTFDSGKSQIKTQNFYLINKVHKAINVFPGSKLVVEGHTDSFGSDESNRRLSQMRAESVRQYIIGNMKIPADKVSAVGYGESKPVANNETREGRRKNRRIDIVIKP